MSIMAHRQESMTHERSLGRGDARRPIPTWTERIFRDQEAALGQIIFGQAALPAGLSPILEATDDGRALILHSSRGACQLTMAQAIHQRQSNGQGIFLRIDAGRRTELAFGKLAAARFRELALDATTEQSRSGVMATTVFVEHAELLDEINLHDLARLADLRREGRISPRLILGYRRDVPAVLADLKRLEIPALRMRPADVVTLARSFVAERVAAPQLSTEALEALKSSEWPGDEAQLNDCLERLSLSHPGREVGPDEIEQALSPIGAAPRPDQSLAEIEEQQIYCVLAANDWNRTRSSQILGIDVKTLYNKLKRYEARKRRLDRARSDA